MDDFKLVIEKIESLKLDVSTGFKSIDKRLEKLEDNHMEVASQSAKHEERFSNMKERIEKTENDLNLYATQRRETDIDQYNRINKLQSDLDKARTETVKEGGELFMKWIPLIGGIIAITISVISFSKK